ncbi:DUF3108 domain-containing protein [Flaviaesturariibacter aridisoli]|uniref:DUF3108 domain-containing protein n=1 Tax=Flaviaesturariibacter aridisoli TaxID=2545761 RepID=A0A4V2WNB5_9BACT|nr:DUF3108 domain-containing protein [Flaviaesturariibacter aridisoli]TCZ74802.1 DUF3108 domain-containing protein [Flaviaesturariibacter aridisoli]
MKKLKPILFVSGACLLFFGGSAGRPQQELPVATPSDFCATRNTTFQDGEVLNYNVYYSIIGIYVNAATATINVNTERLNNRPVYHITAVGKTTSSLEWISKVNDRYETFMDTSTLQPYKFVRNIQEDSYRKFETVTFNRNANTAITNDGVFKVPGCVQDVMSSLYYARNINFDAYKPGDKISFNMFIDNEVYNMYIRYEGKDNIKTKYGKFRAIKFKPLLIKGTVFEGGEKMTVWVSDDENRIPLRVETPLKVGSVKVDMMGYQNLRYPLASLKSLR